MTELPLYPDEYQKLVEAIHEDFNRQDKIKEETGYPCITLPRLFQAAAAIIFADRNGLQELPKGHFELIARPRGPRRSVQGVLVLHPSSVSGGDFDG
jgi:hypothetical protein